MKFQLVKIATGKNHLGDKSILYNLVLSCEDTKTLLGSLYLERGRWYYKGEQSAYANSLTEILGKFVELNLEEIDG